MSRAALQDCPNGCGKKHYGPPTASNCAKYGVGAAGTSGGATGVSGSLAEKSVLGSKESPVRKGLNGKPVMGSDIDHDDEMMSPYRMFADKQTAKFHNYAENLTGKNAERSAAIAAFLDTKPSRDQLLDHNAALDIAVNSFGTQSVINRANRL